jgi:uncharacterized membrane protein YoaK (UPF0700 family)
LYGVAALTLCVHTPHNSNVTAPVKPRRSGWFRGRFSWQAGIGGAIGGSAVTLARHYPLWVVLLVIFVATVVVTVIARLAVAWWRRR